MLKTMRYRDAIYAAYINYDPSEICKYIYELSNDYNSFYHEHNIISETDEKVKNTYILISAFTDRLLRDALDILAIDVPDKM